MYQPLKPYILATDLDNTIVSPDVPHQDLWDYFQDNTPSLIYITGRHYHSAKQLIEEEGLPVPDVLVCDVGASIYAGSELKLDEEWANQLQLADFDQVHQLAAELGLTSQDLPTKWRLAYFATPTQAEKLAAAITANKLNVNMIYSGGRDLDILPVEIDKGKALQYVLDACKHTSTVIVSGDSENDLSLFQLGYPAIGVGNACESIRAMQHLPHVYLAENHAAHGVKEVWEKIINEKKKESQVSL
jgi:sucrose-6-phosphatase